MSEVTLKVDGHIYGGWKSVNVRRSLDVAADTFTLALTDIWAGETQRRPIRMGSACEVWIDKEKIITGYVDEVRPSYDARRRSIEVEGRSKVADLIDCALSLTDKEKGQLKNLTLPALASRLARPFGINVVDQVKTYKAARVRDLEPGQRVFEFLEEIAREDAVLLMSDSTGNLVITRASAERVATPIELGKNVLSAQGQFSMRDRFSAYHFFTQATGWDENHGESSAHIVGRADDLRVRFRPTVIVAEDASTPASVRRRAEWQSNVNYGRSMQATYTVAGWSHADGLWQPNRMVRVIDSWIGIDVSWLISTVRFVLDERGQRTEITVMPREAFDLIPLPSKDSDTGMVWQ